MGGGFSGGGGGAGDSNDGDEEERPEADVTDYGDSGGSPEEEDDDSPQAAAAAASAAGAAAASGASSAGGAAGAGGAVGSGSGSSSDSGESTGEEGDDEEENESEDIDAEQPKTEDPAWEEPEEFESDDTEPEEPDQREELEEPEPEQEEYEEEDEVEEEDEDDEDDDDEEAKEAAITVYTDPWDNLGWGMEPVLKHLQHTFGDSLEISYAPAPVRRFDDSSLRAEIWKENAERHKMPTTGSVWDTDAPAATAQSARAFKAAKNQGDQLARDYLRQLRVAVQVEGRNIENKEVLLDLAENVGLNRNQLAEDWDDIELEKGSMLSRMPVMHVTIDGIDRTWEGYVEYERALAAFLGHAMEPEPVLQSVHEFVEENGPVATEEVRTVFELSRDEARETLRNSEDIQSQEFDCGILWKVLHGE